MSKSNHSEAQMIGALKQLESDHRLQRFFVQTQIRYQLSQLRVAR